MSVLRRGKSKGSDDARDESGPGEHPAVATSYLGRTFQSLALKDYRNLWLSMLFMMGGMNMQMVTRGVLAYDLTNSAFMVGVISAGMAPPIFVFALYGGTIADRLDRKRIIQVAQLGMILNTGFVAMSIHTDTVTGWHLLGAALVQGVLFAFMMPARQSIIPRLVGDRLISNALALNASGMSIMTLAAPGIGGAVYGAWGPAAAYDIIVAFNVGAVLFSALLPTVKSAGLQESKVLADMLDALRYVRANSTVMALLIIALGTTMIAMPARQLIPVYVEESFALGAGAVGVMLSIFGAGALAGSMFIAGLRRGSRRGLVLIMTTALSGASVLLLSISPIYLVAVAVMFFLGVADSGRRALNNALIMEQTDDEHRGRVSGIWMMNFGLMPLGVVPVAGLAEFFGIREAYAVSGAILLAFGIWFLVVNRKVRDL
ncbi:MAG: MFS transporter [Chloroflexota bacterium]